ncbi:MAG: serine hydrolase domain-containing protein [Bacteroidota bacterium]
MGLFSIVKRLFFSSAAPSLKPTKGLLGLDLANALFHNLVVRQEVPGISVTIRHRGSVVLQQGYGLADRTTNTAIDPTKHQFRIASISKCITGLALGTMVERQLLNLDDSVYRYVPYFPKKKHDITLRQLAAHTAGIRGYRGKEYALNRPLSIQEGITLFENDPLVFQPGKGYLYNSFDFVLLSLAMQEAAGMPFETYVQEAVLDPLGMQNTVPEIAAAHLDSLSGGCKPILPKKIHQSRCYTKTGQGFREAVPFTTFYKLAGGGYLSTSADIATMGQAILERRLLNEATYNELLQAQEVLGKSTYYGLGFQVSEDTQGRPYVGHVGNSVGAYTNFYVYPDAELVVAILINCTDPKVQPTLDKAMNTILEDFV